MKEINIARTIINKRKEKGVTQDDLASFIGVSKSSVSKWEKGQSYPDIVFLPQLAAYFNISIDELMGYEPQMTTEDIRKLYKELTDEFAEKPFDEVMARCREIVKKYFSCFPLIYRIGVLYLNYGMISKDEEVRAATVTEAKELLVRVKEQSGDLQLIRLALHTEATCELVLGDYNGAIDLLKDIKPLPPHRVLLSQAYSMAGQIKEAKTELQRSIYADILGFFDSIPSYIAVCADDFEYLEEICRRSSELIKIFNLKKLIPALIMPFYLVAAQVYAANNNLEKSLDLLEEYTDIVTSNIYPLKLIKRDSFFTLIEILEEEVPFGGAELPRGEKSIKQSMADEVTANPEFAVLSDEPRFKSITDKLINNAEKE